MRQPLVASEEPSAAAAVRAGRRLLGQPRQPRLARGAWTFVNVDPTVVVLPRPQGEWSGLDALTLILPQPAGTGLADTETGPIDRGLHPPDSRRHELR